MDRVNSKTAHKKSFQTTINQPDYFRYRYSIVKHRFHVWAGAGDTGTLGRYSGRILDSDNVDIEAGGNR